MKYILSLLIISIISFSFLRNEEKAIYKVSFSSADCYFFILINNKTVYKNEKQYKTNRSIPINEYLIDQDSQRIEYFMYNRHTMMEMTGKSNLEVYVTKQIGEKIDTVHTSNLINFGSKDEKGKMRYASRIGGHGYFF